MALTNFKTQPVVDDVGVKQNALWGTCMGRAKGLAEHYKCPATSVCKAFSAQTARACRANERGSKNASHSQFETVSECAY